MLFNSLQFLIFLPVVLVLYYAVPVRFRHIWLLICSYFFYMCWNAVYALLLLFSTVVTYACSLLMGTVKCGMEREREKSTLRPKLILAASFCLNLGILFFFKYFDFAVDSLNAAAALIGFQFNKPGFDVLLPVGISFYTFQALGYTMDVYRGDIEPEKDFLHYALFVSFFPQLVAGPIERSKNLLPQLRDLSGKCSFDNLKEGLLLMIWGFFMKIVLADRIAILVDTVYGSYLSYDAAHLLVATVLFAFQIYCDFGGYSTIAMGAAKMLNIRLMENFNTPYLSMSSAEFWRRWHVSLSFWFRDYLYIPLGGNRCSRLRKYLNLILTFSISGLWHGANWTYVIWGALNGAFQIAGDILKPLRSKAVKLLALNPDSLGHKFMCMLITFALVDFTWIFFRAASVADALDMIRLMLFNIQPINFVDGSVYLLGLDRANFDLMLLSLGLLLFADAMKYRGVCIRQVIMRQDYWCQALIIAVSVSLIMLFGIWGEGYNAANFIYFQF